MDDKPATLDYSVGGKTAGADGDNDVDEETRDRYVRGSKPSEVALALQP